MFRRKLGQPPVYRFNGLKRWGYYSHRKGLRLWNFLNVILTDPKGLYASGARWRVARKYLRG